MKNRTEANLYLWTTNALRCCAKNTQHGHINAIQRFQILVTIDTLQQDFNRYVRNKKIYSKICFQKNIQICSP